MKLSSIKTMRFGVPFYALAYVFVSNAMYWYRIYCSIGRSSIVGSTVKDLDALPEDLIADEKHSRLKKNKVYLPITTSNGCFPGVSVVKSAGAVDLHKGYQEFKHEAQNLEPSYQPQSVNTDGWEPAKKVWKRLFPKIILMACFLHAYLKVKDRCKRSKNSFYW